MVCRFPLVGVAILFLVSGCRESHEVNGTVTYKSKPLAQGYITFFPVEGPGNAYGAEVVNGAFQVKDMPAGKRRVLITTHPRVAAEGGKLRLLSAETIAPIAVGNNRVVDIGSGKQTLSFEL
jgi:hypothetical protein